MLCERCKTNEASISYMQIVDKSVSQVSLCEQCAKEAKITPIDINLPFSVKDLFASLIDIDIDSKKIKQNYSEQTCPVCKCTYSRFQSTGKLGCETCYDTFKKQLNPIVNRVQGRGEHIGKIPSQAYGALKIKKEIATLKNQLKEAIQTEAFELAAQLRDRIKLLENEV